MPNNQSTSNINLNSNKSFKYFSGSITDIIGKANNDGVNHTALNHQEPSDAIKVSVVGHTNTGKTSLLRTLLRDQYFGLVKNESATTRHVERAIILDTRTEQKLVILYDTPGLEDASGVMDWLEENTASRRDGIERLQQFLASDPAKATQPSVDHADFSQEAKVIRQLLKSDIAIYVIDAREPPLGKFKDELTLLSWSAIPIMPVFNFTNNQADNIKQWQEMLTRRNLHISTHFDSIAFEFNDEITLWRNLATMLSNPVKLNQIIDNRKSNWAELYDDANIIIADFLINIASFGKNVRQDDDSTAILQEMQDAVRQAERELQKQLLGLYKFYDSELSTTTLQLAEFQQDPFNPEVLKGYGIRTTSGAAAGALLGLGIDTATLGASLGLGAAIGGIAGGILSNSSKIVDKITGIKQLHIDPATITLLATRSIDLLNTIRHRGHAANTNNVTEIPKRLDNKISTNKLPSKAELVTPWKPHQLPSILKDARNKPHWSSLSDNSDGSSAIKMRTDAAWKLSEKLHIPNH